MALAGSTQTQSVLLQPSVCGHKVSRRSKSRRETRCTRAAPPTSSLGRLVDASRCGLEPASSASLGKSALQACLLKAWLYVSAGSEPQYEEGWQLQFLGPAFFGPGTTRPIRRPITTMTTTARIRCGRAMPLAGTPGRAGRDRARRSGSPPAVSAQTRVSGRVRAEQTQVSGVKKCPSKLI